MEGRFWKGRRVLVTGHTGFKGSWLCLWLKELGAHVVGYALPPPTTPSLFDAARVSARMISVIADIRDCDRLSAAIAEHKPEIIFHLAAQSLVRASYDNPVETYSTNVMGTVHLLDAVRRIEGVRAVVNITSDKCYENREWVWGYRESDPMGGYDPYSNSKGCAELVTAAFRSSYFSPKEHARHGLALASARAGNVIGGGDWAKDRLIPDVLTAFAAGRPAVIRNPQAIRPWQHVLEPVHGYLLLAERLCSGGPGFAEAWNFGPSDDDARSVEWVVKQLAAAWGDGARWAVDGGAHPHEAQYLKLDCSRARSRLGWRPRVQLPMALAATVEWYRLFGEGKDMAAVSLNQIERYMPETAGT